MTGNTAPVCTSCEGKLVYHRRYTFRSESFRSAYRGARVYRCVDCNLSQADMSLVDEQALSAYYNDHYRQDTGSVAVLGKTSEAIYRRRGKALADLALAHLGRSPKRVFEVGAGYGFNLREFLDRFPGIWVGTDEPSPVTSQHYTHQIQRAGLADGNFDVIVLSHVLEHFSDPARLLKTATAALAEGGVVVIEVPNDVDGILRYNGKDEPHLTFFEIDTLARLFNNAGLEAQDIFAAGPPNVKSHPLQRAKRLTRSALGATRLGRSLLQRHTSAKVRGDDRFDKPNPDGLFIRAVLKA